jgi:flagellin-like protein
MRRFRRWRRARRRGISEIIGAVLLIALTMIAGVILWSFRIYTPPAPPSVSIVIRSGGSNPVWGDPTDCQPAGYNLSFYHAGLTSGQLSTWVGNYNNGGNVDTWYGQCGDGVTGAITGNYSTLNSSEFVITAHSPSAIPLVDIMLTFVCNNATNLGGTTILVNGTLSSMTWFPGQTTQPAANAPYLGYCGSFFAGSTTSANGVYYNRLGLFVPLTQGNPYLQDGDTFVLYIHNGGYPLDFECVANAAGILFDGQTRGVWQGCPAVDSHGNPQSIPTMDYDDYHGAPPWCFQSLNACTIYLTYTGTPSTVLAAIPVYSLAPSSGS